MIRTLKKLLATMVGCVLAWSFAASSHAQDYPKAPLRYIYPFAAGSSADVAWRIINDEVGKQLGQSVVVLNRVGAGGRIGFVEVMRAKPDGYTIGLVSSVTGVMQPLIDPVEWKAVPNQDYTPIVLGFEYPLILVARKGAQFHTLKEFIAYAKAHPGKVNGGSSGIGGGSHLGIAALGLLGGLDITHVPYGGNQLALQALLAGDVDVVWTDIAAKPFVDQGSMIALAVAAPKRWDLFPNVPTATEAGLPGNLELQSWSGVAGPPKMPPEIVAALNKAYNKVLDDPAVRARLSKDGWNVLGGTPQDLEDRINAGLKDFAPIVRSASIKRQ